MFGGLFESLLWGLWMLLHMIIPVLLIVLAVTLGVGLREKIGRKRAGGGAPLSALRERYARGEISRDEFFKMKEELTGT